MPVGDIYRVNIIQAFKGNRMITGFHARALSISASQDDLGNDVVANVLPSFIPAVTQDLGVIAVEVQDILPGTHETIEHTITGNLVGLFVSPSAPPQVAACLSIHSGSKGKRKRGRMFVGGLPAEFVAAGTISGQLLTNLQVFADTLKNRYTLTGTSRNTSYEMVVWSPAAPDFVNKKGVHTRLTDLITGVQKLTVDLTTRTQRRRELGVGA
jgi:hypothetical protein